MAFTDGMRDEIVRLYEKTYSHREVAKIMTRMYGKRFPLHIVLWVLGLMPQHIFEVVNDGA